jgi:hypothetical protein
MNWLYINLSSRTDRKAQVEHELKKIGAIATRIQAVKMRDGLMGCVRSHIKALEFGIDKGWDRFGVVEDDIEFMLPLPELPWCDMFLPSTGEYKRDLEPWGTFHRVIRSQTTSSYIVTRDYAPVLLANFIESQVMLQRYPNQRHNFALDMFWTHLQPKSLWLTAMPQIARQRESFSDIENKNVAYDKRFDG